jgi:sigma-E factor negative regulatory protein RseC
MIEETGVVIKTDGMTATVRVHKRGTCEGCAARGICEPSEEGMEIEALNPVHARVGQTVEVSIAPQTYLKSAIYVYGIPLVVLIAGAIIGKNLGESYIRGIDSDIVAAIMGFGGFFLTFLLVRAWSRKAETRPEYKPVIEKIIEKGVADE